MDFLSKILEYLIDACQWPPDRIHLFGFAQGGSVASELALKWWRAEVDRQQQAKIQPTDARDNPSSHIARPLASVVAIAGPLLSYPTIKILCPTPLLVLHRTQSSQTFLSAASLTAYKKAYSNVLEIALPKGEGMPRSREEWVPIMRFWSEKLNRRHADGLYEVMSGTAPVSRSDVEVS